MKGDISGNANTVYRETARSLKLKSRSNEILVQTRTRQRE
jgi:hypothetical protein